VLENLFGNFVRVGPVGVVLGHLFLDIVDNLKEK
jgi:hypothetical protein